MTAINNCTDCGRYTPSRRCDPCEAKHQRRVEAVPMPKLSDLRECGAMEEDAGMVLGIYRPWVYDPTEDPTTALMPVLKYRKGVLGVRTLAWDGRRMAFSEGM